MYIKTFENYRLQKVSLNEALLYYHENGNLDSLDIPKIPSHLKDFWNQYLKMIDEIRNNNIITNDYLNTSNLGYKRNGNLAVFDIGFGDYFDTFKNEPESIIINSDENLLDIIKKDLNIETTEYIGSGMFGHAHDIKDNKVLKITKDKSEAINSKKIVGKELEHIANVYTVKKFEKNKTYYVIILEKLILSDNIEEKYNYLKEVFDNYRNEHLDISILDNIKNETVKSFLIDMTSKGYEYTWKKWKDTLIDSGLIDMYDFNDISEIASYIKNSKTNNHDITDEVPSYIFDYLKEITNNSKKLNENNIYEDTKTRLEKSTILRKEQSEPIIVYRGIHESGKNFYQGDEPLPFTYYSLTKEKAEKYGKLNKYIFNYDKRSIKIFKGSDLFEKFGHSNSPEKKEVIDTLTKEGYDAVLIKGDELIVYNQDLIKPL